MLISFLPDLINYSETAEINFTYLSLLPSLTYQVLNLQFSFSAAINILFLHLE